jgi:hypothetical protein
VVNEGVKVEPACLRDASYVVSHMRPMDEEEILCQVPEGIKRHEIAYSLLMAGQNYVASFDDVPAMFFGTQAVNVAVVSIWAIGTRAAPRVLPDVTRFLIGTHVPALLSAGFRAMEANSLAGHIESHRWMQSTGAIVNGEPFVYGRNRELFLSFRWSDEALLLAAQRKWKVRA